MDYKCFLAIGLSLVGIVAIVKLDNKTIETIVTTVSKEYFESNNTSQTNN